MSTPKQVIIIRKDLNMRKGKMIAQGAHASMKVIFDMMRKEYGNFGITGKILPIKEGSALDKWINGLFTKIVVGAESLDEMMSAYNEAKDKKIPCALIEDAGLTEFGGQKTITACAIGPDYPENIDKITSKFTLL